MDLIVLDTNLNRIKVIDHYESLIWTERYSECGDFELSIGAETDLLQYLEQDNYLINPNYSDKVMVIEKILISTDYDSGNYITISGRSAESLLDRRVIWGQKNFIGTLQNGIKEIITENLISPTDVNRRIDNFVFADSEEADITSELLDAQWFGENIYEVVNKLCLERGLGFKVILTDDYVFEMSIYKGLDHSYNQSLNPYVVFSPGYENMLNSNYVESKKSLKNIALIAGEGYGASKKYSVVTNGGNTVGLKRRELFVDAEDVSSDVGEGIFLTDTEYYAKLDQKGYEQLAENVETKSFEGAADTTSLFIYGKDFFIGDIVQVADLYGHEERSRVTELVLTHDSNGITMYPTFKIAQEGEIL